MKVTFVSNYINHHQIPFCLEMVSKLGDDFRFISTSKTPQERLKIGYSDSNDKYSFVICTYISDEKYNEAVRWIEESDVVIQGGNNTRFIENRLKNNKLTFRYIERIFKKGYIRILNPKLIWMFYKNHTQYRKKDFYLLSAGGYAAQDCKLFGAYPNKMFKWGYFPEAKVYDDIDKLINHQSEELQLMWAGRFIDWKHSEQAIELADRLNKAGRKFKLIMVGTGPLLESMQELSVKYGLDNKVCFTGPVEPSKVRTFMEESDIYLQTSDYNEGWGAVLNEAMNSGCAVVSSHAIGAATYLIDYENNGLIYKSGSVDELFTEVSKLFDDDELRKRIARNAYNTIVNHWNAKVAAERFIEICDCLLNQQPVCQYENGPCCIEKPIPQYKQYAKLKG